jgi:hypothetical protein
MLFHVTKHAICEIWGSHVTPCTTLERYQCFGGSHCLHFMTEEKGMPRYWTVETETGLQASPFPIIHRYIINTEYVSPQTNVNIWSQSFFRVSPMINRSYIATCPCILYHCNHEYLVCILLPSGSHNLNFLGNECHLYITVCHVLVACFYIQLNHGPLDWRN